MISAVPRGWLILAALVGLFVASLAGFHEFPNRDEFLPIFALSGIAAVVAFSILTDKSGIRDGIPIAGPLFSGDLFGSHDCFGRGQDRADQVRHHHRVFDAFDPGDTSWHLYPDNISFIFRADRLPIRF